MSARGHAARRWAASPLLVDDDVPDAVIGEVVDVRSVDGQRLIGVLVELNLAARTALEQTRERFLDLLADVVHDGPARSEPRRVAESYVRCLLTRSEIPALLHADEAARNGQTIFRIWPDYVLRAQVDRSISTIKADAAARTYGTTGAGVVWAVLDTGIDADHPHFAGGTLTDPAVSRLHRDFTWLVRDEPGPRRLSRGRSLDDDDGHGTHVAGIIAGAAPTDRPPCLATLVPAAGDGDLPRWTGRELEAGRTVSRTA